MNLILSCGTIEVPTDTSVRHAEIEIKGTFKLHTPTSTESSLSGDVGIKTNNQYPKGIILYNEHVEYNACLGEQGGGDVPQHTWGGRRVEGA